MLVTLFLCWSHCFFVGNIVSLLVTLFLCWSHCFFCGHIVSFVVTLFLCWSHCFFVGHIVSLLVTLFVGFVFGIGFVVCVFVHSSLSVILALTSRLLNFFYAQLN